MMTVERNGERSPAVAWKWLLVAHGFPTRFPVIRPLDRRDSICNQLLLNSHFHPYQDRPLNIARKFLVFYAIWIFGVRSMLNSGDFRGIDLGFIIMEKNASKWYIYIYSLVTFWKSCFSKRNYWLKLSRFTCRDNRDSKSRFETALRLVSMPRI